MADGDALGPILHALRTSSVYVGPGTDSWITPAQVRAIDAAVAKSHLPFKVVLVRPPEDVGISSGDDLLARLHDAGAPDGLYIGVDNVWDVGADGPGNPYAGRQELNLALQQWGTVDGSADLTDTVDGFLDYGRQGSPLPLGNGLVQVAQHLAAGDTETLEQLGDDGLDRALQRDASSSASSSASSPSSGSARDGDGSSATPWVVGGGIVLLLAVAAVAVRRMRGLSPRGRSRTFVLPDSALERIREAEASDVRRRADAAVVALGERIDHAELDPNAPAPAAAAWQAALDHYDAAGRLVPGDPDDANDPDREADGGDGPELLDTVGAIVLARRGDEALTAALAGRGFTPSVPCFLNPLHDRSAGDQSVEHAGRRVKAPLCARCRADLKAGRRPDILTVMVKGRPVHYFETDREPWASTGYGALDADLLGRLQGGRR